VSKSASFRAERALHRGTPKPHFGLSRWLSKGLHSPWLFAFGQSRLFSPFLFFAFIRAIAGSMTKDRYQGCQSVLITEATSPPGPGVLLTTLALTSSLVRLCLRNALSAPIFRRRFPVPFTRSSQTANS
jgi:hypothetical protein